MSHEQSETEQNPRTGLWVNRYGRKTEKAGQVLPRIAGSGKDSYESLREADTAATYRSMNEGFRHGGFESHMPKGGKQSPGKGESDLGVLRQREAAKLAAWKQRPSAPVAASRTIPTKTRRPR